MTADSSDWTGRTADDSRSSEEDSGCTIVANSSTVGSSHVSPDVVLATSSTILVGSPERPDTTGEISVTVLVNIISTEVGISDESSETAVCGPFNSLF